MPRLDPNVSLHHLSVEADKQPKVGPRRMHLDLVSKVEPKSILSKADFIREVQYSTLLANIIWVKKKNEKILISIDLRDLNKASPNDECPVPHTDYEALMFMDGC